MNGWQAPQQIQYLLRTLAWEDSPYGPVFDPGSVLVTGGVLTEAMPLIRPVAMILPGEVVPHPDLDGLGVTTYPIRIVHVRQDRVGEAVLLGGNRHPTDGAGSSEGRGLLEYAEQVCRRLDRLDGSTGMRIHGAFVGAPEVSYEADLGGYVASRTVRVAVDTTRAPYFAPPQRLVPVPAGGGTFQITTTWALPAYRHDFHPAATGIAARGKIILRRRQGLTAPTGPTDGVGVTLSGDFATTVTEVVSAIGGAFWTYGVFAAYDETPDVASEGAGVSRYSDAGAVGTYRTVQTS